VGCSGFDCLEKEPEKGVCQAEKLIMEKSLGAGSEIVLSWLPMQLNILHWQPEFHNWLPVGD